MDQLVIDDVPANMDRTRVFPLEDIHLTVYEIIITRLIQDPLILK